MRALFIDDDDDDDDDDDLSLLPLLPSNPNLSQPDNCMVVAVLILSPTDGGDADFGASLKGDRGRGGRPGRGRM